MNDLIAWFKNPNPDTVLLKYWQRKRSDARVVNSLESKQQQEQDRQIVATQAYLLWEVEQFTVVALEPHNTNYIDKSKQNTTSNPKEAIDCSR